MVTRLALLAFMATFVFSTGQFEPINELYVFETVFRCGTVFQAQGERIHHNALLSGRYSNGRVWVEYIVDHLHQPPNPQFACGGATTGNDRNSLVPGLLTQVQSFKKTYQQTAKCTVCAVGGSK